MDIRTQGVKFYITDMARHEFVALWLQLHHDLEDGNLSEEAKILLDVIDDWADFFSLDLGREKTKIATKDIPF